MGYFAPTFLAYILNSCGVCIFYDSVKPGCEPLVSCLIFLTAVFLLLWEIRLFPRSLRKLWRCGSYILQFLMASFLMEHIMNDFWFPLEQSLFTFLPKIAEFEEEILKQSGWSCSGIFQFLKADMTKVISSYLLSLFFFCAVVHATRLVDFRLMKCGPNVFIDDVRYRTKKSFKRLRRMFIPRHKVQFQLDGKCNSRCPIEQYLEDNDLSLDYNTQRRRRY